MLHVLVDLVLVPTLMALFFIYKSIDCIVMCVDCIIIFAYGMFNVTVATEVMTVFVFHEPSQLSALQDNGLPGVVLNSLLMKNVSTV